MTEKTNDRQEKLRSIVAVVAIVATLLAAMVFTESLSHLGGTRSALGWLAAIPGWVWLTALIAYVFWLTRKLHDIDQQQKRILQLLTERRTDDEKKPL